MEILKALSGGSTLLKPVSPETINHMLHNGSATVAEFANKGSCAL